MNLEKYLYHRRSIRLKDYDYSSAGEYFITICTYHHKCIFGNIINGEMHLSSFGKIIEEEWMRTATIRSNIELEAYIVMPNHFHGIIILHDTGRGALSR